MDKNSVLFYKKLLCCINHHQLPNEYVLNIFFCFFSNNSQEQLVTIQHTRIRKNAFGACIMS